MFWNQLAPRIAKLQYTKAVVEQELTAARMSNAADFIDPTPKRKPDSHTIESRPRKLPKSKKTMEIEVVEHDDLFVGDSNVSVGTIIKRKALQLFSESKTRTLSARERKEMSNGLSSILDLVRSSKSSRKSLFTQET